MIGWLQEKLLWLGGIVVGALFLYGMIRREAWKDFQAREARKRLDSIAKRKEVDDDVSRLGNADLDDRLAKWLRDRR